MFAAAGRSELMLMTLVALPVRGLFGNVWYIVSSVLIQPSVEEHLIFCMWFLMFLSYQRVISYNSYTPQNGKLAFIKHHKARRDSLIRFHVIPHKQIDLPHFKFLQIEVLKRSHGSKSAQQSQLHLHLWYLTSHPQTDSIKHRGIHNQLNKSICYDLQNQLCLLLQQIFAAHRSYTARCSPNWIHQYEHAFVIA